MNTASQHGLVTRVRRATPARAVAALALLTVLAAVLAAASVMVGSAALSPADLFSDGEAGQLARDVFLGLRLPRALAAFAVGGLLALAGALMQVLLRNPLAEPYVLGVSGGASVGAMTALLLIGPGLALSAGAAAGALGAILAVFTLGRGDGSWSQARLLLTGVAVAAFCNAATSLLLSLAPDGILRGMVFWLLGDLAGATWQAALATLGVLLAVLLPFARDLNVLALGAQPAHALGVDVARVRRLVYLAAALATAVAVITAGMIGFIGLLVPHALRLLLGSDQRLLLPAAALGGGGLLMAADLVSRTLIAPQQLPVGVITAAAGAPVFLWLLNRGPR